MADSQSFLNELCQVLELPEPEPTQADESHNNYVFEKAANFNNGDGTFSDGRLDLYRQKSFVLESKQGAERRANELAAALATVTKQQKHRKGTAQRGTAFTRPVEEARQGHSGTGRPTRETRKESGIQINNGTKKGKTTKSVVFIDAGREYKDGKNQVRLSMENIEKIVDTYYLTELGMV